MPYNLLMIVEIGTNAGFWETDPDKLWIDIYQYSFKGVLIKLFLEQCHLF